MSIIAFKFNTGNSVNYSSEEDERFLTHPFCVADIPGGSLKNSIGQLIVCIVRYIYDDKKSRVTTTVQWIFLSYIKLSHNAFKLFMDIIIELQMQN